MEFFIWKVLSWQDLGQCINVIFVTTLKWDSCISQSHRAWVWVLQWRLSSWHYFLKECLSFGLFPRYTRKPNLTGFLEGTRYAYGCLNSPPGQLIALEIVHFCLNGVISDFKDWAVIVPMATGVWLGCRVIPPDPHTCSRATVVLGQSTLKDFGRFYSCFVQV